MNEIFKNGYFTNETINKKFEAFKNLIIQWNKKFNITSIIDEKEIYIKHFYDSIKGGDRIVDNSRIIEIGSGGGFPSIPLKIYRDNLNFTLVEATKKKCDFLNEVKSCFCFENFEIINERCEELGKNIIYREKFDYCIARAVAPLNTLCEYMLPFVKIGGLMLAYKGLVDDEIKSAENAIIKLGGELRKIESYTLLENMGERNIIVIEKIKKTPDIYPRGRGKERSLPL